MRVLSRLLPYARAGRLSAEYVAARLGAARAFESQPIDELLVSLSKPIHARKELGLPAVLATIKTTEALLARLHFRPDTCLFRAVARYSLLAKLGYRPRFVMGVSARTVDEMAHAWVELDDNPILEGSAPAYQVTYAYPGSIG